jgi:proteasome assembly chaperone 3
MIQKTFSRRKAANMASFTEDPLRAPSRTLPPTEDADFFEYGEWSKPTVRMTEIPFGSSSSFPPQRKTSCTNPAGVKTDIVCTTYADYHFVTITQLQKFGTVIHAWADKHSDGPAGVTYEMNVLLGKREDTLLMVYARQIMQRICMTSTKPLVLAIALKEGEEGRDADTFAQALNALFAISTWG